MAALDSHNKFICHPDYEHHISKNILVIKAKQRLLSHGQIIEDY